MPKISPIFSGTQFVGVKIMGEKKVYKQKNFVTNKKIFWGEIFLGGNFFYFSKIS